MKDRHVSPSLQEFKALQRTAREQAFEIQTLKASIGEQDRLFAETIRRTRLLQKKLIDSRKLADAANQAKSQFLANMSHEIRTPMNGVLGIADMLMDTDLTVTQRDHVELIQSAGESLLSLINEVLDFAKIEAGKVELEEIPFNLEVVVYETIALLAGRAEEKGFDLCVDYCSSAARHFIGDPTRIRQILTNLVGNALKFTECGFVLLHVSRHVATGQIQFDVTDSGPGIPEDKLPSLFEHFTQAEASTTRTHGGTGLGLAICKKLVAQMDGEIGVNSEPGKGSTFYFRIPLILDESPQDMPLPRATLAGVRILIVDDLELNRRILENQLSSWNMVHGSAVSGREALEVLRRAHADGEPYQIALVNYQMPAMDGETLAKEIKTDPAMRDTVLVMLASVGQQHDAERMKKAGFSGYLVKPASPSVLQGVLATVWGLYQENIEAGLITRHTLAEAQATQSNADFDSNFGGARVLLVEDNAINQMVARAMLEKLGCNVDVVADGLEAVQALSSLQYQLVLMDCQMPEMDGFEATAVIRDLQSVVLDHQVVIVAMTAHTLAGSREKCQQAGMNDYVSKPVRLHELRDVLERWLRRDRHRTS